MVCIRIGMLHKERMCEESDSHSSFDITVTVRVMSTLGENARHMTTRVLSTEAMSWYIGDRTEASSIGAACLWRCGASGASHGWAITLNCWGRHLEYS